MSKLQAALQHRDGQRLRDRMERAIERLIALLDAVDGDPDIEDNGDYDRFGDHVSPDDFEDNEPSLGWSGIGIGVTANDPQTPLYFIDLEDQCDDEGAVNEDAGAPPDPRYEARLRARRIETAARRRAVL